MVSETRVQSRIRIPLDFSELKKRSKVADKEFWELTMGLGIEESARRPDLRMNLLKLNSTHVNYNGIRIF